MHFRCAPAAYARALRAPCGASTALLYSCLHTSLMDARMLAPTSPPRPHPVPSSMPDMGQAAHADADAESAAIGLPETATDGS